MSEKNNQAVSEILALINQIREQKLSADYVHPSIIPDIDLYMDQVTTFMDEHLSFSKRYDEDKILTKTMINNYAKNQLLPPPEKKKYSKDHILLLTFIYYYKNILSINDIQTLLEPIKSTYFKTKNSPDMTAVYDKIFQMATSATASVFDDMTDKLHLAGELFKETSGDEKNLLTFFSFICLLSYDIYLKKQIVEKLIDKMSDAANESEHTKDKKNKKHDA